MVNIEQIGLLYLFTDRAELVYDKNLLFQNIDPGVAKYALGNKAHSLVTMSQIGIPIPPGIVISTKLHHIQCAILEQIEQVQKYTSDYSELSSNFLVERNMGNMEANFENSELSIIFQNLKLQLRAAIQEIENIQGKKFGCTKAPLLFSARSGAAISMPGMMETILNLGLNNETVEGLAKDSCNPVFAYDSYCRLLKMYAEVIAGVNKHEVNRIFAIHQYQNMFLRGMANVENIRVLHDKKENIASCEKIKQTSRSNKKEHCNNSQLELLESLSSDPFTQDFIQISKKIIAEVDSLIFEQTGTPFPQDPYTQIMDAIRAVLESWNAPKAKKYRAIHGISDRLGTAITIQAMVFGNLSKNSATGVVFSRNPSNGENQIFGEFLPCAQGEVIVSGEGNALPINQYSAQIYSGADNLINGELLTMENSMPESFAQLEGVCAKLEEHYSDMQDIEFTVEDGVLWILQARSGKRTTLAALNIAMDMILQGYSVKAILSKVDPKIFDSLLHPQIDNATRPKPIAIGLAASPGAASGCIALSSERAEQMRESFKNNSNIELSTATPQQSVLPGIILIRQETSPDDIAGMHVANGIITGRGGMTSHAAVVARSMGKPCVCAVQNLIIEQSTVQIGGQVFCEGDVIGLDGATGEVFADSICMAPTQLPESFFFAMRAADEIAQMSVYMNAETVKDIEVGLRFGAEGIGLCRTEHMFFEKSRIMDVRGMILLTEMSERAKVMQRLLYYQSNDFREIFTLMKGREVTIRLLDPPLHEFLPYRKEEIEVCAEYLGMSVAEVIRRTNALHEENPMLGHRGVRLAVAYPEIYAMQVDAIIKAYLETHQKECASHRDKKSIRQYSEQQTQVSIMIPFVCNINEVILCRKIVMQKAKAAGIPVKFGVMIEIPRAALIADQIAQYVDFISFGTNDLTQMTLGLSRDDSHSFIHRYIADGIFNNDPFISLDLEGVGTLISVAIEKIRNADGINSSDLNKSQLIDAATPPAKRIKIGVCGEHGGDRASIEFFNTLGLDYISCSPYRIPAAKLTAAIATMQ